MQPLTDCSGTEVLHQIPSGPAWRDSTNTVPMGQPAHQICPESCVRLTRWRKPLWYTSLGRRILQHDVLTSEGILRNPYIKYSQNRARSSKYYSFSRCGAGILVEMLPATNSEIEQSCISDFGRRLTTSNNSVALPTTTKRKKKEEDSHRPSTILFYSNNGIRLLRNRY